MTVHMADLMNLLWKEYFFDLALNIIGFCGFCFFTEVQESYKAILDQPYNEPPHKKTNKMACAPSELAQSDQSLGCPHEESLGP